MKQLKKTKFSLEKFEVAKFQNLKKIIGGTSVNGDPADGTDGSSLCSKKPTCKDIPDDDVPLRPSNNC